MLNGVNGTARGPAVDPDEQAGGTLRSLFRAEIKKALRPPKAAARLAEIEGQVSKLLESVAASRAEDGFKRADANGDAAISRTVFAQVYGQESAYGTKAPRAPCAEVGVQTEACLTVSVDELLAGEPPPEPLPVAPSAGRRRSMVVRADGAMGNSLRTQVQDARRRLLAMDGEVTRLTAELKRCRTSIWNQQKRQCSSEAKLAQLLKEHAHTLSPEDTEREAQLQREERQLAQELREARALTAKWSSVAKRQDGMLQQDREHQRGDAQIIIAKHPAGEVFLPHFPPDGDSDDGIPDGHRRGYQRAASGGHEDVSLGTSDEEDDDLKGGRPRPPTLRSPLGLESEKDDESASGERSSLPSPSGESLNSASRSPAGETPNHGHQFSSALSSSGTPTAEVAATKVKVRKGRRSTSTSDTSSEEDEASPIQRGKLAMASLAGATLMEHSRKASIEEAELKSDSGSEASPAASPASASVPPLPQAQLSSASATRGRPLLQEDEAEEITSEDDDFEAESSRSAD